MDFVRRGFLFAAFFISINVHGVGPSVKTGDLIFHASTSTQADAIMWATHSKYSHVGIIEVDGRGNAYVVEAIRTVSRTPLANWIARGRSGKYTLLRSEGIPEADREKIVGFAKSYLGYAYDPYFTFVNKEIYCSELIYLAYQKAGYSIGTIEKVSDLDIDHQLVKDLVKARWKNHPLCKTAPNFDICWDRILNDRLISPESVSVDPTLTKIFSNF